MDTLPNGGHLITHSTMQGLSLNDDERKKTVNGYFANVANSDAIQSPVSFEPGKETLNGGSPVVEGLPFLSFGGQGFNLTAGQAE